VAAQTALSPRSPEQRALRAVFAELAVLPDVERHLSGLVSGLDIRYAPADPAAHPLTGVRLHDFDLPIGKAGDLFHAGDFVLLTTNLPVPLPQPSHLTTAQVPELPWPDATAVLVHPDGYIAYATTDPTPDALTEALKTGYFSPDPTNSAVSTASHGLMCAVKPEPRER
jgi:hypothetical protein